MENWPVCRKEWVRRREVTPPRLSAVNRQIANTPPAPPGVSLAYQPPDSPRDWRVPPPKSPYMHCTSQNRYTCKQSARLWTVYDRFFAVRKRGNENPREGNPGGFKAKVKNLPRSRTLHRGY